jgi:tetratricopeptide (TPR) repeat protein
MGYSEDVAAHRLWDEVVRINDSTPTAKDRVTLLPASQQMDFEAPGAGVSLQAVVQMLRPFLGLDETRIAGEFICRTTACKPEGLALRLRVFRGSGMKIISLPPIGDQTGEVEIGRYFRTAALELLRELDPYVVAFFLYRSDKAVARREALQLIAPKHPQRKWAFNLLGLIAANSNEHDDAIEWYRRAIAADKDDRFAIAYNNWGDALRAKGYPDKAIAKYERAIKIDSKNVLAYSNWGSALLAQGKLDEAIAMFTKAIKIDSENVLAYNIWGSALYSKGNLDGAIAKYTLATEADPKDALAYYNLGIVFNDMREWNQAIANFRQADALDPDDAATYTMWGVALHENGNPESAIEKFTRAAEIDPDNPFIYIKWGNLLGGKGGKTAMEEALQKFERVIELDSRHEDAHWNKAYALEMLGRAGDAADTLQSYLDLNPEAGSREEFRAEIKRLRTIAAND